MLQIKLRNKTDRTNRTEFDLFPFVCSFCERRQTVKIETFRQTEFAVFIKIVWCRCSASAAIQLRKLVVHSTKSPPERSKPLSGENLIYQVRELRRNPLWSYAVPVTSRNFVPRPLAAQSVFFRGQLCRKYEFTVRRGKFLRLKSFILRFF